MGFDAEGAGSRISIMAGTPRGEWRAESANGRAMGQRAAASEGGTFQGTSHLRLTEGRRRRKGGLGFRGDVKRKEFVRDSEWAGWQDVAMDWRASSGAKAKQRTQMGQVD